MECMYIAQQSIASSVVATILVGKTANFASLYNKLMWCLVTKMRQLRNDIEQMLSRAELGRKSEAQVFEHKNDRTFASLLWVRILVLVSNNFVIFDWFSGRQNVM